MTPCSQRVDRAKPQPGAGQRPPAGEGAAEAGVPSDKVTAPLRGPRGQTPLALATVRGCEAPILPAVAPPQQRDTKGWASLNLHGPAEPKFAFDTCANANKLKPNFHRMGCPPNISGVQKDQISKNCHQLSTLRISLETEHAVCILCSPPSIFPGEPQ